MHSVAITEFGLESFIVCKRIIKHSLLLNYLQFDISFAMNFENDLLVPMSTSKYAIEYDVGDRLPEDDYQSIIETLQIKFCQLP